VKGRPKGVPRTWDHAPRISLKARLYFRGRLRWSTDLETQGPLGTLWVGFGLCAFYIALIWLNTLLGVFLTPLFIIPGTWLLEWLERRRRGEQKAQR
jgi:hypothetical protein